MDSRTRNSAWLSLGLVQSRGTQVEGEVEGDFEGRKFVEFLEEFIGNNISFKIWLVNFEWIFCKTQTSALLNYI